MLSITLLSHKNQHKPYYISKIRYGTSLNQVMSDYAQTYDKLYNKFGQEIPHHLWTLQIKENMSFYTDVDADTGETK